jgi:signal transduction histidine kinase
LTTPPACSTGFTAPIHAVPHNRGGTGLGLAITAAILEAHHGRIELHTTPRHGTTFRVLVPLT